MLSKTRWAKPARWEAACQTGGGADLGELFLESHDPKVIEAVDQRGAQVEPIVGPIGKWLDLVGSEGVLAVGVPCPLHHAPDFLLPLLRQSIGLIRLGAASLGVHVSRWQPAKGPPAFEQLFRLKASGIEAFEAQFGGGLTAVCAWSSDRDG